MLEVLVFDISVECFVSACEDEAAGCAFVGCNLWIHIVLRKLGGFSWGYGGFFFYKMDISRRLILVVRIRSGQHDGLYRSG